MKSWSLAQKLRWIENQNVIKKLYFYPQPNFSVEISMIINNYYIIENKFAHFAYYWDIGKSFELISKNSEPIGVIEIINEKLAIGNEIIKNAIMISFKSGDSTLELYQKYQLLK